MNKNCLIVQSGGPTSVINSTLHGLITGCQNDNSINKVYGAKQGIYGLLTGNYVSLDNIPVQVTNRLKETPGIALGSWRHKLTDRDIDIIIDKLLIYNINILFFIGGNGSMYVANKINNQAIERGIDLIVVGIPKTIDNDIMHTHHSPGYGSAAKFLATCTMECGLDIKSLWNNNKVTILETMGRNTGWLAAATALAKIEGEVPHHIFIPEVPFYIDEFLNIIEKTTSTHGYAFIVVSEGIRDNNGVVIGSNEGVDRVGRPSVGGVSAYLTSMIENNTKYSARYVVPSIMQRTGMHLASKHDLDTAYEIGLEAVKNAVSEIKDVMVALEGPEKESKFKNIPLTNVAGIERSFPLEWYDSQSNSVEKEFLDYVRPLIQGEPSIDIKGGLPSYQSNFLSKISY